MPISDDEVERALHWLTNNAKTAGELRGNRIKTEAMLRHIKAVLFGQCNAKSAAEREAWACAHARYSEAIETMSNAVVADEENRALREAAVMRCEVWRTQSSNARGKL